MLPTGRQRVLQARRRLPLPAAAALPGPCCALHSEPRNLLHRALRCAVLVPQAGECLLFRKVGVIRPLEERDATVTYGAIVSSENCERPHPCVAALGRS